MAWEIWDPFDDMSRMMREMGRALRPRRGFGEFRIPLANVYETDNQVIAEIELPGISKENIDLNVTEDYIEVKAEHKLEKEQKQKQAYRYESSASKFYRRLPLPAEVKAGEAKAEFKNGILKVEIPKAKIEEKKKKIDIK